MLIDGLNEKDRILAVCGRDSALNQNLVNPKKLGLDGQERRMYAVAATKAMKNKLEKSPDVWRHGVKAMSERGILKKYLSDSKNLLQSASQTIGLLGKLEHSYSGFFDSTSYKNMMAPLRQLRDKMAEFGISRDGTMEGNLSQEQSRQLNTLLRTIAAKSAEYVSEHASRRGSAKGKGRFDTAMEIIGAIDMDMAYMAAESVNGIRKKSKSSDKQIIDISRQMMDKGIWPGYSEKFTQKVSRRDRTQTMAFTEKEPGPEPLIPGAEEKEEPEHIVLDAQEHYQSVETFRSQEAIDNMIQTHQKVQAERNRRMKEAFGKAGKAVYGSEEEFRSKVSFAELQKEDGQKKDGGILRVQELNPDTVRRKADLLHEQEKEENRIRNRRNDPPAKRENPREKDKKLTSGEEEITGKNKKNQSRTEEPEEFEIDTRTRKNKNRRPG